MSLAHKYFDFIDSLDFPKNLPDGVKILNPFEDSGTYALSRAFYDKFYGDSRKRLFLIGINPGRFGAGITGVPFTDPIRLLEKCQIPNKLHKRQELSSVFVYDMIGAFGGVEYFYSKVFFTSVSPLGFVKDGINLNYYDLPELKNALEPFMVESLRKQIEIGGRTDIAFAMGQGANFKYIQYLNKTYSLFDRVEALPHPRWIMQYRLKSKENYILEYVNKISDAINTL